LEDATFAPEQRTEHFPSIKEAQAFTSGTLSREPTELSGPKGRRIVVDFEHTMNMIASKVASRAYRHKSVFLAIISGIAKPKSPTLLHSFSTTTD
jgi:hypothetical protein